MPSVPAVGAAGTLTIQTNRDCTWSASTATPWIALTSSANGQGEATVSYRVDANADPSPRHGIVTVNDATADITQEAAPCRFTVSPAAVSAAAAGGSIAAAVTASSPACAWTAASTVPWISIGRAANTSGNGVVTLNVQPNGGDTAREGRVVIAEQTVTVTQPAPGLEPAPPAPAPSNPPPSPGPAPGPTPAPGPPAQCTFTLDPPTQTIPASRGSGSINVSTASGCAWSATTSASWIIITAGSSAQGSGTISFNAAANSGNARSATIHVGASTATITQAAPSCRYTIAPASQSFGAEGGTGVVTVKAGDSCSWTATKDAGWITITGGANGTGDGSVSFSVTPNSGGARSAAVVIAGRTFTVTQAAPPACSYSIAPASQNVPAGGGNGTVTVTAASGCAWTASSNANWIALTSAASGSGNGTIAFAAGANTGPARSGTLTVAGQTFTVQQDAAASCSFSLSAGSQNVAAAGGSGSVGVNTDTSCPWTAASNAPWISIVSGSSGTGNGSVAFAVAANNGTARTGTLTIAGQTFTVSQDAAPCSYSIAPTSQNVAASGGTGTTAVAAGSGCAWTASSNAPWITVTAGAAGNGPGSASFAVAANTGSARNGTLTVAGQTFTVNQDAMACTFSVVPTSANIVVSGGGGSVTVTADASCSWTAASGNPDWLSITTGASGSGAGTVSFSATVNNTGAVRIGTLTVAGQTVTVMQAGS